MGFPKVRLANLPSDSASLSLSQLNERQRFAGKELTLAPARSGMANSQAGCAALLCFRVALFRRDEVISLATFAEGRFVLVFGGHLQLGDTIGGALLLR